MKLSRLHITGKISLETPLDVILEIIECHDINCTSIKSLQQLSNIIDEINQEKVSTVKKKKDIDDYGSIAIFVNPNVDWNISDLDVAYKFLKSFYSSNEYQFISPDFSYGLQTPENINSLNACVLYGACKFYDISINYNTTIEEMSDSLKTFLISPKLIINSISNKLLGFSCEELIRFRHSLELGISKKIVSLNKPRRKNEIIDDDIVLQTVSPENTTVKYIVPTYEELKKCADNIITFYPINESRVDYKVKTYCEAIVLASLIYSRDLIQSKDPIKDYNSLKLKNIEKSNFNPRLPFNLYTTERLNELIEIEGHSYDDLEDQSKYELLQIINLSQNFYHGKMEPFESTETIIELNNVNELSNDECISFGLELFKVLTYKELNNWYRESNNLYEPCIDKLLSDISIKKLLYLSKVPKRYSESMENYEIRKELHENINVILEQTSDKQIKELNEKINKDTIGSTKEVIEKFLDLLLDLGMNMRGWNGIGEYPITRESTILTDQLIIDRRVNETLHSIQLYQENFPECVKILKLPLVKYQDSKYISSNTENGLTIGDRIEIIKKNESIHACIRTSSNWILSSIYKYNKLLLGKNKFDIRKMNFIF